METRTALSADIWGQTPPEAQAYIQALEARVAGLEDTIAALQEQLNQTSRNSSRPPSSDPPSSPRPKRPRSQRRRGGQPGHPGQTRTLIPVEEIDQIVPRDRDSAHPTGGDGISMASAGLPQLRRDDARSLAQRCSQWDLRSSGACHGGAVHGALSLVET